MTSDIIVTPTMPVLAGELFYASGEVAVKAPHAPASSHAPRLALRSACQPGDGGGSRPPPPRQRASTQQQQEGARESDGGADVDVGVDIEVRLKGALESLSVAETRMAELAREAIQARFEFEDEQAVLATANTKVGEYM